MFIVQQIEVLEFGLNNF